MDETALTLLEASGLSRPSSLGCPSQNCQQRCRDSHVCVLCVSGPDLCSAKSSLQWYEVVNLHVRVRCQENRWELTLAQSESVAFFRWRRGPGCVVDFDKQLKRSAKWLWRAAVDYVSGLMLVELMKPKKKYGINLLYTCTQNMLTSSEVTPDQISWQSHRARW